jgi:hypothetical protein
MGSRDGQRPDRVPVSLSNPASSRRHGRPSWKTTNRRRKKRRRWKPKRKKLGAQVKGEVRPGPGRPGRTEPWVSPVPTPSQMRSRRRAAAVRRRAARTSALAARVNGKRVTGTRRVTRVAVVRMKAVRMKPGLLGTKKRSLAVTPIQRMMLTLMMRTDRPMVAVTMTRTAAVMGVAREAAARAGAAAPALSPVAASTLHRRMAVKPQFLILVMQTATVTEP